MYFAAFQALRAYQITTFLENLVSVSLRSDYFRVLQHEFFINQDHTTGIKDFVRTKQLDPEVIDIIAIVIEVAVDPNLLALV
jgi:hypothetical protein